MKRKKGKKKDRKFSTNMATEFSQPIYTTNNMTNNSLMDSIFNGTIKTEFKEEQSIDLDDSEFDRVLEQVPSFDQYLMNNITNSPYQNSCEFSIAPSLLHSPSSSSLLSSDSLSLSSIASSSSSSASASASLPSVPSSSSTTAAAADQFMMVPHPNDRIHGRQHEFFPYGRRSLQFEQKPFVADEFPASFMASSTTPPPLLLRPQALSLACFDIKKHDTISSYLQNIDLDENSR